MIRLLNSQIDGLVGALRFGFGLARLELVEVQRHAVVPDRRPGQELPNGLLQFAQAVGVAGQEDERVLVIAGR